ncbi:hypothetical protein FOZ60_016253, partial [Perkinsus olseni]
MSLRRQLEFLENRALEQRENWARAEDSKLTTGLAKPELCVWGVVHGPHSEMQAELNNILTEAVDEVRASPAGKFLAGWVKLSREDQANFSDSWTGVEEEIDRVASRMRDRWCQALGCSNRQSLSGSPLRVPLLKSLLSTWRGGAAEDESILDDVDSGVNIEVRYPISRSHIWPEYSGSSISDYYTVSSFEKDAFVNYQSAEENPEQVERELEKAVMKGHMVKVGEELPPGHEDAVVSRVASIPKASGSWRIIDDMKRSGLNTLIKMRQHMVETICLPTMRAVALLLSLALSWFSADAVIIELDAKEAFKHLRISSLDEVFVYNCAPGSKTLYRHLRLAFGCISSPLLWVRAFSLVNRVLCAALQLQCIAYIDDTSFYLQFPACLPKTSSPSCFSTPQSESSQNSARPGVSRTPRLLGFQCDLSKEQIDIPQDKLSGIAELGETVLAAHSRGEPVRVRCVETLLGKLMDGIRKNNRDHTAYLGRAAQSKIRLLLSVLQCEWLRARSITSVLGHGLLRGQSVVISDASLEGFGGTCCVVDSAGERHRWWFAVSFDDSRALSLVKAVVPSFLGGQQFTSDDVSCLELVALVVGLLIIPREYTRLPCTLLSDNTSAVAAINRSYSSVPRMAHILARLSAVRRGDRRIQAFHLPGIDNEETSVLLPFSFGMNQQIADECYAHLAASLPLVYGGGTLVNPSPSSGVPAPPSRSPQSSTTQLSYKPNPSDRRASQPYTHPYGIRRPVKFSEGLSGLRVSWYASLSKAPNVFWDGPEPVRAQTLSATELATLSKLEPSSGRACAVAAYLTSNGGSLKPHGSPCLMSGTRRPTRERITPLMLGDLLRREAEPKLEAMLSTQRLCYHSTKSALLPATLTCTTGPVVLDELPTKA